MKLGHIIKILNLILTGSVIGLVGIGILLYVSGTKDIANLPKAFVILSGSMEPAIKTGGIVIVKPESYYITSDIISFHSGDDKKNIVTHRIDSIVDSEVYYDFRKYITKGDANNSADSETVDHSQVIGRVILTLPYLGYCIDYLHSPPGFILFVIVPATIIIYEELKNMKREIWKFLSKLFSNSNIKSYSSKINISSRMMIIIPVIMASALVIGFSKSFFLDSEISQSNVFGAATVFATPTPTVNPTSTPTPTPVASTLTPTIGPTSAPTPTPIPQTCVAYCQSNGWIPLGCSKSADMCKDMGGNKTKNNNECQAPFNLCCCSSL